MGVWIETGNMMKIKKKICVTPFVGVWIETSAVMCIAAAIASHTLRGCVD